MYSILVHKEYYHNLDLVLRRLYIYPSILVSIKCPIVLLILSISPVVLVILLRTLFQ